MVDIYGSNAFGKLHTSKLPETAVDALNDGEYHSSRTRVGYIAILTDRGTEFCGRLDKHPYQLYLQLHDIKHTRTKARHPQTNGICERFHKTVLDEFYKPIFRKKVFGIIDELQVELDIWIEQYNRERTHQGKRCQGRTPMQTFIDGLDLARKANLKNEGKLTA